MSTIGIANPMLPVLASIEPEKHSVVTVNEIELPEDAHNRSFHDTGAAYVLPNE